MNNKIRTLLIDEDEVLIQDVKKYFSSSSSIDVIHASYDGNTGLEFALKNMETIDLVIMDTLLPEKDGLDLLEEFNKAGARFKIILTSSVKNPLIFNNIDNYNVGYVFLKPYKLEALENIIDDLYIKSFMYFWLFLLLFVIV